ncbi:sensor domain-containing diguanylate cyclase [Nocardia huaxiensis]|uniref:GGDEF domain-containing protein n=1 Tax=Nocardia huaxiensis TaxID=2755382 RepID=A0A7D6Z8I8_9NOCA|nr:sensor domain-containing diguanylate cyclase [Nocardia huaxiensis]QLY27638.1 GGDEF domain-containing protein [Nocardia huaxiensis]UFS98978.1 sensor domain-containing diguanylate cyclase [Nocardia huaxiensis]
MGAAELARRWAAMLDGSVAPTLTRAEVERLLTPVSADLIAAVRGTGDPAAARGAARALLAANYRDPLAVHRSVLVLCRDLVEAVCADPGCPDYGPVRDRAIEVAAEFAATFTAGLRTTALAEQEATISAAITAARDAEARRQLSEARFRAIFEGASVGIGTVDITTGRVVDVNNAMAEALGVPADSMPGRTVADILGPANMGAAFDHFQRLLSGEIDRFRMETLHTRPDQSTTVVDLSMTVVRDTTGHPRFLVGVTVDVTERKQLADRLWHDAHHDSLTGLPNRLLFFNRLTAATGQVGVCYLDLDGFKEINDQRGHTAGDQVLRDVAHRLRAALPPTGTAARLGGDEFIILLENCSSEEELAALSDTLLESLSAPFEVAGLSLPVGASIGTALVDTRSTAIDELMHVVDTAMYRNKATRHRR